MIVVLAFLTTTMVQTVAMETTSATEEETVNSRDQMITLTWMPSALLFTEKVLNYQGNSSQ